MGRFQFLVHGYDEAPAELYGIPNVRKFYQHFHRVWPYCFFFCDLREETSSGKVGTSPSLLAPFVSL
jgi:hypothetical protein